MNSRYTPFPLLGGALLLAAVVAVPHTGSADGLFDPPMVTEDFDFDDGLLMDSPGWTRMFGATNPSTALQVIDGSLRISWRDVPADEHHGASRFNDDEGVNWSVEPGDGAVLYAAFDLTVLEAPTSTTGRPSFHQWRESGAKRGLLGLQPGSAAGTYQLGTSAWLGGHSAFTWADTDLDAGETYRIVVAYEVDTNITHLWIEPEDPLEDEPLVSSGSAGTIRTPNRSEFQMNSNNGADYGIVRIDNYAMDMHRPVVEFLDFEAPFALDFGTGEGQNDGAGLLMTPPQDQFVLQDDSLRFLATSGSFVSSSAMASVANYLDRQDFVVESEMVLSQLANFGNHRAGLAVLGGPHDPDGGSSFNTADDEGFYGLMWYPAVDGSTSLIEIRKGFDGDLLAEAVWEGAHPSAANAGAVGQRLQLRAEGVYDDSGVLELTFSVTDQNGHAQSLSTLLADPFNGNLFGIGGRIASGQEPEFDFNDLSMEIGEEPGPVVDDPAVDAPFNFAFGSADGRDSGDRFSRNIPDAWSLQSDALRLAADSGTYQNSLATTRVVSFSPGRDFLLAAGMTLESFDGLTTSDNRAGIVLFGDSDREVFDPNDDATYYTFQWIPNAADGASIVVRRGMNGDEVARTDFADLENPPASPSPDAPSAGIGNNYSFSFQGLYNGSGDLEFLAILSDGAGGSATVSGVLADPPDGNRFGFGARHRDNENPVWDFHGFTGALDATFLLVSRDVDAPIDWDFGVGEGQIGLREPLPFQPTDRPEDWSLVDDALRMAPQASSNTSSALGAVVANYHPGQDFTMTAEITLVSPGGGPWEQINLGVLGEHGTALGTSGGSGYGISFEPHQSDGRLRIRNGWDGPDLQTVNWEGLYAGNGAGTTYSYLAVGEFDDEGVLTLSFSLTDENGHSQTMVQVIENPDHGNLFGVAGRGNISGAPAWDYHNLTLTIGETTLPDGMTFAQWQSEHFTETEQNDPGISGPLADPARDGVANFIKYAFGLDPKVPVSGADLPRAEITEGLLRLTYPERIGAEDIEYVPEFSGELDAWQGGPEYVEEIGREPDGDFEQVTVQAIEEAGATRGFLRVTIRGN